MTELSNGLAYVATFLLIGVLLFDLRRGLFRLLTGRSVVLVAIFYWYLLEAIRIPVALTEYTSAEYRYGLMCVGLSLCAFLAGYHGCYLPFFRPLGRRLAYLNDPRILWTLLLAGITIGVGALLIYVNFDVASLFEGLIGLKTRWSGIGRGRYGSWSTLLYELQMFLQASVPIAVCLAFMKRASRRATMLCILVCHLDVLADFFQRCALAADSHYPLHRGGHLLEGKPQRPTLTHSRGCAFSTGMRLLSGRADCFRAQCGQTRYRCGPKNGLCRK